MRETYFPSPLCSNPNGKGGHYEGVFSLEESLEPLNSSLEALENGRILKRPLVQKTPFSKGEQGRNTAYLDTEYDRAKVPPYNGNVPRPPLVV